MNCCTWCWKSALTHCNRVRINPDPTQALCTCISHTSQWKLPWRSLQHTLVLTEITSTYGFHKGIYNLRYCFVLVFSLKAQRILDQGFKILSEMGLSDYIPFVLLFESLRAHCNSKDVSREKHNKSWARDPCNKPTSTSVHSQRRKAGTSILTQEAWETARNSPFLFSDLGRPFVSSSDLQKCQRDLWSQFRWIALKDTCPKSPRAGGCTA